MSKKPAKPDDELSFEEALAQVESIIERIEGGQVGLEASVAEYEKGVAMIRRCRDVLTKAEQRVEQLNRDLSQPAVKGDSKGPAPAAGSNAGDVSAPSEASDSDPDADEEAPF